MHTLKQLYKSLTTVQKIGILASVVFLMFLGLIIGGIQLKFAIGEELSLSFVTNPIIVQSTNDESLLVSAVANIQHFSPCVAECVYSMRHLSDIGTEVSHPLRPSGQRVDIPVSVSPFGSGHGVDLYSVELECKNVRSFLCRTSGSPRYATQLIIVNVSLNVKEEGLRDTLRPVLMAASQVQSANNVSLQRASLLLDRIPSQVEEKSGVLELFKKELKHFDRIESQLVIIQSLWDSEEYTEITIDVDTSLIESENLSLLLIGAYNNNSNRLAELQTAFGMIDSRFLDGRSRAHFNATLEILEDVYTRRGVGASEASIAAALINLTNAYGVLRAEENDGFSLANIVRDYGRHVLVAANAPTENGNQVCSDIRLIRDVILSTQVENATFIESEIRANYGRNVSELRFGAPVDASFDPSPYSFYLAEYCQREMRAHGIAPYSEHLSIVVPTTSFPARTFSNPHARCCVYGACSSCVRTDRSPILFIHGHSLNEKNTPEHSMNAFDAIQRRLVGYVNGGEVSTNVIPQISAPLSFRGSYYYVFDYELATFHITAQKSERIENYALRLHDMIQRVLEATGAQKVTIIAHSMGGLVAREYIAIFGEGAIDRVITINTPHHGLDDSIVQYCSLIGAKSECEDMRNGSIFLQRLNARPVARNIVSIRSTGCPMGETSGDGIVVNESAYLSGAVNIELNGKCTDTLQTDLHTMVLDPLLYPELVAVLNSLI